MNEQNKGGECVLKDTCKVCRESMLSGLDTNEKYIEAVEDVSTKRLDAHAAELKELTKINIDLVATQKQIADLLKAQDNRLKALEDKVNAPAPAPKKPWYDSDIGKWLIKAGVVIFVIILLAAIGTNAIDKLKLVTDAIPK